FLSAQHTEHGLPSAALRIFNIYGPRQDERLVLPRFIRRGLAGEPLELYGDGMQTRDFVYVSDVVNTMLACADTIAGCGVINACSGDETSVLSLARAVVELTGSRSEIMHKPQPAMRSAFEVARSFGSRTKFERLLGKMPRTSLKDGLRKTIEATRAQP